MTNEQIIYEIALQIYGEEKTEELIEKYGEVPLHTLQGWKMRGNFIVKKGEKGLECRLWKKKKSTSKEETMEQEGAEENQDATMHRNFYLCKSYLFRADQVEKGRD